jgi:hypothetical protein
VNNNHGARGALGAPRALLRALEKQNQVGARQILVPLPLGGLAEAPGEGFLPSAFKT